MNIRSVSTPFTSVALGHRFSGQNTSFGTDLPSPSANGAVTVATNHQPVATLCPVRPPVEGFKAFQQGDYPIQSFSAGKPFWWSSCKGRTDMLCIPVSNGNLKIPRQAQAPDIIIACDLLCFSNFGHYLGIQEDAPLRFSTNQGGWTMLGKGCSSNTSRSKLLQIFDPKAVSQFQNFTPPEFLKEFMPVNPPSTPKFLTDSQILKWRRSLSPSPSSTKIKTGPSILEQVSAFRELLGLPEKYDFMRATLSSQSLEGAPLVLRILQFTPLPPYTSDHLLTHGLPFFNKKDSKDCKQPFQISLPVVETGKIILPGEVKQGQARTFRIVVHRFTFDPEKKTIIYVDTDPKFSLRFVKGKTTLAAPNMTPLFAMDAKQLLTLVPKN